MTLEGALLKLSLDGYECEETPTGTDFTIAVAEDWHPVSIINEDGVSFQVRRVFGDGV